MQSKYDEELFEWHLTCELVSVDVPNGTITPFGPPRMYADVTPSPDDTLMIVSWIERPFSYGTSKQFCTAPYPDSVYCTVLSADS